MISPILKLIDPDNLEDQNLTYDVIKYRWSKPDIINIKYVTRDEIPSFEEHVKNLKSPSYKKIYKILLNEVFIGVIYLKKDDNIGTFVLPSLLKKALKTFNKKEMEPHPLSAMIHREVFKDNPDVEVFFAKVNPENMLSVNALMEHGYEPIEITLAIKTKDGKVDQGKWFNHEYS
jgi:hypothetical protein